MRLDLMTKKQRQRLGAGVVVVLVLALFGVAWIFRDSLPGSSAADPATSAVTVATVDAPATTLQVTLPNGEPAATTATPGTLSGPKVDLCLAALDVHTAGATLSAVDPGAVGDQILPYLAVIRAAFQRLADVSEGAIEEMALSLADQARVLIDQVGAAQTPEDVARLFRTAIVEYMDDQEVLFDLLEISCPGLEIPGYDPTVDTAPMTTAPEPGL